MATLEVRLDVGASRADDLDIEIEHGGRMITVTVNETTVIRHPLNNTVDEDPLKCRFDKATRQLLLELRIIDEVIQEEILEEEVAFNPRPSDRLPHILHDTPVQERSSGLKGEDRGREKMGLADEEERGETVRAVAVKAFVTNEEHEVAALGMMRKDPCSPNQSPQLVL